jgi:UDP-N-acetyl-D-mannosaminuronic acid dehydrogenase
MNHTPSYPSVCVLGLGYIGLPTASLLASKGFSVHGVDVSAGVVDTINAGRIHIREPELDILVKAAVQSGRLKAGITPEPAEVFIIAVPTPFTNGHKPDLSFVEAASRSIAPYLRGDELIILESTSPVGTTERVAQWIAEERPDQPDSAKMLKIAHCPERVLPGQILRELVENDRIVGGIDDASTEAAAAFYERFVSGEVLRTSSRTAELAKLAENTFRDVNIALANELSLICDRLGIDVWELIALANRHPRVNILKPGPGVGGHCIAVDPWFIVDSAPEQSRLIHIARQVNQSKPEYVVARVQARAKRIHEPTIACFGLAYKADIDDLRESPALEITRALAGSRAGRVLAVEPHIESLPKKLLEAGVEHVSTEQALAEADILVGLVAHRAFRKLPPGALQEKIVIDTCGIWR